MLVVMTVATSAIRGVPRFLESCRKFGIAPIVLGRGQPWRGFGLKLGLVRDELARRRRRDAIMLFADACDSLVVRPPDVILAAYRAFRSPLVFSAERWCSPDPWKAFLYPSPRERYRFLNAGGYMGDMETIYGFLKTLPCKDPFWVDDQRWWTDRYLEHRDVIRLDIRCRIFQALHGTGRDVVFRKGFYNASTRTRPSVLHGNGGVDMRRVLAWSARLPGACQGPRASTSMPAIWGSSATRPKAMSSAPSSTRSM
ncbi:MAG TPA: hypothetical protein DCM87_18860 [Planctomycetes bacterium]|jgi:hypothetical protein|nr:hypothetical protein [Planctomycetota bacterium]